MPFQLKQHRGILVLVLLCCLALLLDATPAEETPAQRKARKLREAQAHQARSGTFSNRPGERSSTYNDGSRLSIQVTPLGHRVPKPDKKKEEDDGGIPQPFQAINDQPQPGNIRNYPDSARKLKGAERKGANRKASVLPDRLHPTVQGMVDRQLAERDDLTQQHRDLGTRLSVTQNALGRAVGMDEAQMREMDRRNPHGIMHPRFSSSSTMAQHGHPHDSNQMHAGDDPYAAHYPPPPAAPTHGGLYAAHQPPQGHLMMQPQQQPPYMDPSHQTDYLYQATGVARPDDRRTHDRRPIFVPRQSRHQGEDEHARLLGHPQRAGTAYHHGPLLEPSPPSSPVEEAQGVVPNMGALSRAAAAAAPIIPPSPPPQRAGSPDYTDAEREHNNMYGYGPPPPHAHDPTQHDHMTAAEYAQQYRETTQSQRSSGSSFHGPAPPLSNLGYGYSFNQLNKPPPPPNKKEKKRDGKGK